MPGATALRCFVAAFEEHSADEKHVGWGVTNQRIMARPDRVPFVSLPHFPKSPSPLISSSQPARCFSVIPSMAPVRLALHGPMPQKPRMLRSKPLRLWTKKNQIMSPF